MAAKKDWPPRLDIEREIAVQETVRELIRLRSR